MSSASLLLRLAVQNACANLRLQRACANLTHADWEAERTGFFQTLPRTLNHILTVDWYYLDALERGGKGLAVFDEAIPYPKLDDLAREQRAADLRLYHFVERLVEGGDLDAEVRIDRGDHVQSERVADVLLHLTSHQIHHRGQAHAMLSGSPVPPPQLDEFIFREELPLRADLLRELRLPLR